MKFNKSIIVFLCGCLLILSMSFSITGEEPPDGFKTWDDYYNYLVFGETDTGEVTDVHDMKLVSENKNLKMYFNEKGADLYVEDLKTGKIWGTAIDDNYINTQGMAVTNTSNLMTVSYADKDNNVTEANVTSGSSEQAQINTEFKNNKVVLNVSIVDASISFTVNFELKTDGVEMVINDKSIKESGAYKLVSITALPLFGASKPGEEGYIFYPDGSGALINIAKSKPIEPQFYSYTIYGDDTPDFEKLEDDESQDIKNLMLPVYGIKQTNGGIFAEIREGDSNAILHISADSIYQSYFELVYRTQKTVSFSFASKEPTVIKKVGNKRISGDRKIFYHILSGNNNTYSNMAVIYRNSLINRKMLTKQNIPFSLSLETLMGISKSSILGSTTQIVTNFDDVNSMANDLYSNGVKNIDILLKGWCEGGYTVLPTSSKTSSKLGGKTDLKKLSDSISKNNGNIYKMINLLKGDSTTGKFNPQKQAIRDSMDTIITDSKDKTSYFLNPLLYMQKAFQSFNNDKITGYCFDDLGRYLFTDEGKSNETTRYEIIKEEQKVVNSASKISKAAVSGGNSYLWSNVDRMYDIPDTDSSYIQTDTTVPFYQMIVHGYIPYSSMAANLSYDYNYQKLKFVETGSIPHFVITEKSPNLLRDTKYDKIFSSQYSQWKDKILSIYKEMNDRIGSSWSLTIDDHTYLQKDLVRITYSDSSVVYINYSKSEKEQNGVKIPAMDYVHVSGGQS